jgi:hypothetical protein
MSQGVFRESAAEDADGRDLRLPGRCGIVGRIADRHGVEAFDLQFLQDDLEHVRGGFGFFCILGRGRDFDQFGDAGYLEIPVDLGFLS